MGSDNGGKTAAVLYSIMASFKANQVETFAYVRDLLVQLSRNAPPPVTTLLPDAWLVTHPDSLAHAGRGSWANDAATPES